MTWLDWYILGAADRFEQPGVTDLEAMRIMVAASTQSDPFDDRRALYSALLPWMIPADLRRDDEASMAPPLAYQLSAELLSSLIRGNPPNTEDHLETLANHNLYLDLPGRGLPITDEQSIRAIFVQPTRIPFHWMVVCVLTAGHANAMTGRYAWIIGKDGELTDQVGLSIEADLPPESINRVVMRIIKLTILYAMAHDTRSYLPSISAEALQRLKPKKQRARQKTHSLFSVRKLERQPSDRLPTGQRDGWTLAHVVEVSEHFRWQAHGAGRKLRKLIWIEAYERGVGEKKPTMTRL